MAEGGSSNGVTESSTKLKVKEINKDTPLSEPLSEGTTDDKRKKRHPPRHNRYYNQQYYYRPRHQKDWWRNGRNDYYYDTERRQTKNGDKIREHDIKVGKKIESRSSGDKHADETTQHIKKVTTKNDKHLSERQEDDDPHLDRQERKRKPYSHEKRKQEASDRGEEVKRKQETSDRGEEVTGRNYRRNRGHYKPKGGGTELQKERTEEGQEEEGKVKYVLHKKQDGTIKIEEKQEHKPSHFWRKEIKKDKVSAIVSMTQSDELSQQLMGGVYECSVCCERVKHYQEVWSCSCCYHIFHLRCIRRWAHSLTAAANEG